MMRKPKPVDYRVWFTLSGARGITVTAMVPIPHETIARSDGASRELAAILANDVLRETIKGHVYPRQCKVAEMPRKEKPR